MQRDGGNSYQKRRLYQFKRVYPAKDIWNKIHLANCSLTETQSSGQKVVSPTSGKVFLKHLCNQTAPIYASLSLSAVFPLERWKRPIVCQFASGGGELTLQRGGKHWFFSAVKKTRGYKLMFFSEVQLWIRWQDCLRSLRLTEKSAGAPDKDWQRLP